MNLPFPRGWRLFWLLSLTVLLMSATILALAPDLVDGLRQVIRATARSSLALFLLTFAASSLAVLLPSPSTRALVSERRYLGLAFAASHLVHAVAIYAYARVAPELFFNGRTLANSLPGSLGYLMILLLAITSFRAPARLLGPRAWKALHRTGVWAIWLVFMLALAKRVPMSPWYLLPLGITAATALLRLAAWWRRRSVREMARARA